jgi:hypothetical protein
MPSIQVQADCPLQGPGVDVVVRCTTICSTVLLCVTGSPCKGILFLAHGILQNSSSIACELHHKIDRGTLMAFHCAICCWFNFKWEEEFAVPYVVHSELKHQVCNAVEGLMKPTSWLLDPLNFLFGNCHNYTYYTLCSPGCFVLPIARVL